MRRSVYSALGGGFGRAWRKRRGDGRRRRHAAAQLPRLRPPARLAGDHLRGAVPGHVEARGAAISDTLDKRQAKIQGDLDAAEKASEETRALVAAYEKRLADAREDARRLQRERGEADSAAAAAPSRGARHDVSAQADRRGREAHRRSARPGHGGSRGHGARHRRRSLQQARRPAGRCQARCGPRSPLPREAS